MADGDVVMMMMMTTCKGLMTMMMTMTMIVMVTTCTGLPPGSMITGVSGGTITDSRTLKGGHKHGDELLAGLFSILMSFEI